MLAEIVQSVRKAYTKRPNNRKHVELEFNFAMPELNNVVFLGDCGRITHVILNIFHNSLKFAPDAGAVKINFNCVQLNNNPVNSNAPLPLDKTGSQVDIIDTTCSQLNTDYMHFRSPSSSSTSSSPPPRPRLPPVITSLQTSLDNHSDLDSRERTASLRTQDSSYLSALASPDSPSSQKLLPGDNCYHV